MKRFTETQKWDDPWFRKLSPEMKLLWQWILDRCDNAGVIDPDIDLASFQIGYQYPMDTLLEFAPRVIKLQCGKWFIVKFIEFQYGKLSVDCKAHNPIFISLQKHDLKGYPKGINTLQEKEKEKEKEKERENSSKFKKPTTQQVAEYGATLNPQFIDSETFVDFYESKGWKIGKNPMKSWQAAVRTWNRKNTPTDPTDPTKPAPRRIVNFEP